MGNGARSWVGRDEMTFKIAKDVDMDRSGESAEDKLYIIEIIVTIVIIVSR